MFMTGAFVFLLVCLGIFCLFFFAPWESGTGKRVRGRERERKKEEEGVYLYHL